MKPSSVQRCFLLTQNSRDTAQGFEIELFARNEEGVLVRILITTFRPLFFVPRELSHELTASAAQRKELPLATLRGEPVDCCYFDRYSSMQECAARLRSGFHPIYESDVHPADRYLMERSIAGDFEAEGVTSGSGGLLQMVNPRIRGTTPVQPDLKVLSIDIETNVAAGTLYSIACAGIEKTVFILGNGTRQKGIVFHRTERGLLEGFFSHLAQEDPDIIIGWNCIDFDLKFLFERCRALDLPFRTGRHGSTGSVFPARSGTHSIARIPGRVVIDVPMQLRTYYPSFEEYSLNFVAGALLGKSKEITLYGKDKIAEIDHLYATDIRAFAGYNLQDALLTREIFETTSSLPDAIERSRHSGHLLDRLGGSIAAFDYLYLPRLHRSGYVADDAGAGQTYDSALPGGFVLEPQPGIFDNVIVLDFRSLYPSIIMSFLIDPLGRFLSSRTDDHIQGPAGPPFSRSPALLPGIITELLNARVAAKRDGNAPLSQAIKILMNSFYGVLGARNCRFFSAELATTITRTGQYILKTSIGYIEKTLGFAVIYGDTDSLFIHLGPDREQQADETGNSIAGKVTGFLRNHLSEKFGAESALLLQYENHFRYFLIPAVRGASHGSKKHYCGGKVADGTLSLHFKGMEAARTDWTDLAKEFQRELIRRVFSGEPVDDFIIQTVKMVSDGKADDKLIYKKRLRKHHDAYTQNIPPHVQAARQLDDPPHLIRYCITVDGPQPLQKLRSPLDYRHYIDAQLHPVADSVLELVGRNFSSIISGQQDLFSVPDR
ncbi:MAG: DNA polymerase II [Chitinispirillaceae bacterium]|nr:DNA polymerase II [Chitinispirillaceae bacterium]